MPPVELSNKDYEVISGEINVTNFSKGSDWFNMSVDVEDKGMLQISQYYFPNWKIFENS